MVGSKVALAQLPQFGRGCNFVGSRKRGEGR
jgi:hypothetical protein